MLRVGACDTGTESCESTDEHLTSRAAPNGSFHLEYWRRGEGERERDVLSGVCAKETHTHSAFDAFFPDYISKLFYISLDGVLPE